MQETCSIFIESNATEQNLALYKAESFLTLCNLGFFFKFYNTVFKKSDFMLCNAEHIRKFF